MGVLGLEPVMAWMEKRIRSRLLPILLIAFALTGCEFSSSTAGDEDPGNRGREAEALFSTITGTGGTSTTAATVTVTLQSEQGFPLFGIVPSFTVTPLSSNDFGFTCGATNAQGEATCSFRSFDAGVAKTLVLTSPVSATGNSVTFTQSASQLVITTEPDTGFPTTGEVPLAAGFATQPVLELRDPLNVIVATDSSTVVTVTQNTVSTNNTATPTLFKNDASCTAPCQVTAAAGVVDYSVAGNQLSTNIAGQFTFTFSGDGLTSATSQTWETRATDGASIEFTTQPDTSVTTLTAFTQAPVVTVKDTHGNVVERNPGTGDDSVNVTLTLTHPDDGTATVLGNTVKRANEGVADYAGQGIRVDSDVPGTGLFLTASATLGAGAVNATSNTFELTSAGIPAKLAFQTQPSTNGTTGVTWAQQPVVVLQDVDGNTVTSENTLTVTLSLVTPANATCQDEPPAINPATPGGNAERLINGIATYSGLSINRDSDAVCDFYQIEAAIATNPEIDPVTSEVLLVGAAGEVASALSFSTQPTSAGKDQTMTAFAVDVVDAGGTIVSDDNSTVVVLSLSTGTGTLGGTISQTVVNGRATFSDITISETGIKILTASANNLTSAASNSFFIDTSGTASAIEFTSHTAAVTETAGVQFVERPVVKLIDANSNDVGLGGVILTLSCTNPANCTLLGPNLQAITDANGDASFATNIRINTSTGSNIQLTATADDTSLGINPGSTLFGIQVDPAAANNFNSSIAASAPTAPNTNDGIVIVILRDQFGNNITGATVTLTFTGTGTCSGSCDATDPTGQADCTFSCNGAATGNVHNITINQINGAAHAITKSTDITAP